jgi:cell division protein FtsL
MTVMLAIAVVLLVAGLCVGLMAIGYIYAACRLLSSREAVEQQRQQLDAEWRALDNTRRLRAVFLDARRQMAEEARLRGMQSSPPAEGR